MHSSTIHTPKMLEIIRHSGKNISSIPPHLITSGFSSSYSRLDGDEPSVTITVNFVHPASNRCIHPEQDRALTPREGARLQSFDDIFDFAGNRTEIVKQIGNAVPPLLGKAIAESISAML
jgi:DNA (cytosine-5)-methyltransferase 1